MKKLLIFLTAALLLLAAPAAGQAAQPVTVTLDGEALRFDAPPVLENGRVLNPGREPVPGCPASRNRREACPGMITFYLPGIPAAAK